MGPRLPAATHRTAERSAVVSRDAVERRERASRARGLGRQWTALLVATLTLLVALVPMPGAAAFPEPPYLGPPDGFTGAETEHVRVFVEHGAAINADAFVFSYGLALDRAYEEISTLVGEPSRTMELIVYADSAGFTAATSNLARPEPVASNVAVDFGTGDLAVALPPFLANSPLEAENQLRHALAHALVRRAAGGQIPRGFDEGIALYVERPVSGRLARTAALLQNANQRSDLLTWSDLNRPRPPAADPNLVSAHAYGIIAFLVERHGLRQLGEFVNALADEPDWRSAMREVYQRSPTELEEQWQENLPRWTAGDWRDNLFAAFDLQPARDLLAQAHYAAAKTELERSLRLYTDLGDTAMQAEVEALLRQGDVGLQAEALMAQTQEALERHTYDRAQTLITQARSQYALLPPNERTATLLDEYETLAQSGLGATVNLDQARHLSHRWADYPEARASAVDAGAAFAALGDEEMTERSQAVLDDLDARQQRLVLMLGALAVLTIAWLALWLWARGPAELDWQ